MIKDYINKRISSHSVHVHDMSMFLHLFSAVQEQPHLSLYIIIILYYYLSPQLCSSQPKHEHRYGTNHYTTILTNAIHYFFKLYVCVVP